MEKTIKKMLFQIGVCNISRNQHEINVDFNNGWTLIVTPNCEMLIDENRKVVSITSITSETFNQLYRLNVV